METNSCLSKHSLSSFPSFFRRNMTRQEGRSECNIFLECRFRSSKLRSLCYRWKFPRFFARFYDIAIFIIVCRRSSIPIRYKSLSVTRYVTPPSLRGEIAKGRVKYKIVLCPMEQGSSFSFSKGGFEEEEAAIGSASL